MVPRATPAARLTARGVAADTPRSCMCCSAPRSPRPCRFSQRRALQNFDTNFDQWCSALSLSTRCAHVGEGVRIRREPLLLRCAQAGAPPPPPLPTVAPTRLPTVHSLPPSQAGRRRRGQAPAPSPLAPPGRAPLIILVKYVVRSCHRHNHHALPRPSSLAPPAVPPQNTSAPSPARPFPGVK